MSVIDFPSEPRIGWVDPATGDFLGWAVDFSTPSKAAYVVFVGGEWKSVENSYREMRSRQQSDRK